MNKQEAKELTLKVWRYLMWRPWITHKVPSPTNTPLCKILKCSECPLYRCCGAGCPKGQGLYEKWLFSKTPIGRFINAARIVKKVKEWEV